MDEEERGVIMAPIEATALNKQMAMLNKEVARIATKQKMAKYLENHVYFYLLGKIFGGYRAGYLAAFFVHSPDLHPALALLCSCKSFKDFKGL